MCILIIAGKKPDTFVKMGINNSAKNYGNRGDEEFFENIFSSGLPLSARLMFAVPHGPASLSDGPVGSLYLPSYRLWSLICSDFLLP